MATAPSLKGLQALEAAARTGSFAAAARELSVSPAAISQLIRSLEDQVGHKLFYRVNRGITPTEAALEILPRLSAAFEELKYVSNRIAGSGQRSRLTVSVPPSMASGWLSLRIAEFVALHGSVDISLRGEVDPVAFERDRIDIRMSFGGFHYRAHGSREIVTDAVLPVCSPAFMARHGPFDSAESLADLPLIHTDWGPASASIPAWRHWFQAANAAVEPNLAGGIVVNSSADAVNLAISGLGVALCQGLMAAGPVETGQLLCAFDRSISQQQPYCLTIPQRSASRPVVSTFEDWLTRTCIEAVGSPHIACRRAEEANPPARPDPLPAS